MDAPTRFKKKEQIKKSEPGDSFCRIRNENPYGYNPRGPEEVAAASAKKVDTTSRTASGVMLGRPSKDTGKVGALGIGELPVFCRELEFWRWLEEN